MSSSGEQRRSELLDGPLRNTSGSWVLSQLRGAVAPLITILVVWCVWEFCFYTKLINLTFFPPPSRFIPYAIEEDFSLGLGRERNHVGLSILSSFWRVFCGLITAFTLAVATGVMISVVPFLRRALMPIIRLLAPIAPVAWIPLAMALFGIGNKSAVALVFMGTYPILVIATAAAIQQVDPELLKTASSLGATSRQRWVYVILPAVLPNVFTMLRINFIAAWMAVLAAEMVGLRDGLGVLILIGRESSNPNLILVGMTLIGVCGFFIDYTLLLIQRRLLWWGMSR
jgi:NitT/TauT family transport system permease protein